MGIGFAESKSKRIPLKKKHKVIRKVKEHHKKKAKEAKKLGFQRKKVEKDPGIPNDWPFKEQELKALETRRARVIDEMEQKKAARKERVFASKTISIHFCCMYFYTVFGFGSVTIIPELLVMPLTFSLTTDIRSEVSIILMRLCF